MSTSPQPPSLNFITALSQSKRILHAHSRHFLALSVFFLLPLSFSIVVLPTVVHNLNPHDHHYNHNKYASFLSNDIIHQNPPPIFSISLLLVVIFYSLIISTFAIFAIGSITYSVYHGFYGRPVKLISAIKSSIASFMPLFITSLTCHVILYLFAFLMFAILKLLQLGFHITYYSPYFIILCCMPVLVVFVIVAVYLLVIWCLVSVIVVVESGWGWKPLMRSYDLIKGMKTVALSALLFFGFIGLVAGWSSMIWDSKLGGVGNSHRWKNWGFVLQIVVTSTLFVLLILYSLAVNTVLYMYCKALHGELAMEIAEEFATEYVSLPLDDGKVPHVVSVAYI
ncbi:hypothetical protein ACFE04_023329 [Oxalis oulophora]